MKILIFALNDIYFGIPFADISFVEGKNKVNIEKMSDVSGYITGMAVYHNMTIPVYNLPLRLGLMEQQLSCLAVVSADNLTLGIEVGVDSKILDAKESEIFPLPALMGSKPDFFANIVLLENKNFAYLLDVRKLIHSEEKQEICQLIKRR